MGGPNAAFPATRWSVIRDARQPQSEALNALCQAYWKPVYAWIRASRAFGNEDAKDLTQEFFAELVDGGLLARFTAVRGSFRAYLRGALDLFLRERRRADHALKRGGGRRIVSLADEEVRAVDATATRADATIESAFDHEWINAVLAMAVADLRAELARAGRETWFAVFERHELTPLAGEPETYAQLADAFGLKPTDVSNYLVYGRRRLRELVVARIADTVADEQDLAREVASLFPS